MESIIFNALVGVFALVGVCSIISALYISFYSTKSDEWEYIILPVKGHMEDIEFRIRGALARRRRAHISKIYLADFGADDETAEIARKMCGEFEVLEWVDSFELTGNIRDEINSEK